MGSHGNLNEMGPSYFLYTSYNSKVFICEMLLAQQWEGTPQDCRKLRFWVLVVFALSVL